MDVTNVAIDVVSAGQDAIAVWTSERFQTSTIRNVLLNSIKKLIKILRKIFISEKIRAAPV